MQTELKASIRLGDRVYDMFSWKRKDKIFLGDKQIGVITLSEHDRTGVTVSLASNARNPGRQIQWCVDEFQRVTQQIDHRELQCA